MALSLQDSVCLITDPENLRASVCEVFETMLGVQCSEVIDTSTLRPASAESVTAVVGFGGILSGACVIQCNVWSARRMAERLAGTELEVVDETVKDAVGEICNMVAGTWKSMVPALSSHCVLSVPAVITGHDYKLHLQAPEFRLNQTYSFEQADFEVTIISDGLR